MKLRTTKFEQIVSAVCLVILGAGTWAGFQYDPAWLNRCGSLVIVVGILVAVVRVQEIVSLQVDNFRKQNEQAQLGKLYEAYESFWGGPLSKAFKDVLKADVGKKTDEVFGGFVKRRVQRMKHVEVTILVVGTLANGFGDWLIKTISGQA